MIDACLDRILGQRTGERLLVAIVGPPGSGKSTLADALYAELARHGASSAVLPMDGFHYDDAILRARLMRRWRALGLPEGDAAAKVDANDMPNGLTVLQESRPAQITLAGTPSLARGHDARAAT